jgi:hypothetical protein
LSNAKNKPKISAQRAERREARVVVGGFEGWGGRPDATRGQVTAVKKNLLECIFFLHAEMTLVFCKCELA